MGAFFAAPYDDRGQSGLSSAMSRFMVSGLQGQSDMHNLTVPKKEGAVHVAPKGAIKTIISKSSDGNAALVGQNSRISRG